MANDTNVEFFQPEDPAKRERPSWNVRFHLASVAWKGNVAISENQSLTHL